MLPRHTRRIRHAAHSHYLPVRSRRAPRPLLVRHPQCRTITQDRDDCSSHGHEPIQR
jgi:hypothetical protein